MRNNADMPADQAQPGCSGWTRVPSVKMLGAMALGAAIPAFVTGPVPFAILISLALVIFLPTVTRSDLVSFIGNVMGSPLGIAFCLVFAAWFVSAAIAPDPGKAFWIWLRTILLLAAGSIFVIVLRQHQALVPVILRTLIISFLASCLLGLLVIYVLSDPFVVLRGHDPDAHGPHYAALITKRFGVALGCLVPATLWAGWRLGGRWFSVALAGLIPAIGLLLTLESLAGVGAAALGGVLVIGIGWFFQRLSTMTLVAAIGFAGAMVLAAILLHGTYVILFHGTSSTYEAVGTSSAYKAVLDLPEWTVDAHRQTIWVFVLSHVPEAPWFGLGIDASSSLPGAEHVGGATHPHNVLIEVLVETGVVGFALFTVALAVLVFSMIRTMQRYDTSGAGLAGLSAAFWFASMFAYSFWSLWWLAVYVLLFAIIASTVPPGILCKRSWLRITEKS